MKTIVVGAGYWGRNYCRELGHNCVGVVDPDAESRIEVNNSFNIKSYPSIEDVDVDYQAAIIATPPVCHTETALKILEQNKPVLIEKPMTDSLQAALKLAPYRRLIMVGHIYMYHPGITALKTEIKGLTINHIFTRRTNSGPIREWQDALWDLAPHDISICNYLFSDSQFQTTVEAEVFKNKDFAVVQLAYIGGPKAVIYVSWLGRPKTRKVEIVTEDNNRIVFDDMKFASEVSPMRLMLDDFMSGQWKPECSYEAGLSMVQLLESLSD